MKRKILFLLLPSLLFASCGRDDGALHPDTQANELIRFDISIAPVGASQLRATTSPDFKTTWEDGDEIGIFAVKHGEPLLASGNFIHNMKLTRKNDGTWNINQYWPNDEYRNLDFYAYCPFDAAMTDPTAYTFPVKTDQRVEADYNRSDLLLATAINQSKDNTVSLQFGHALSLVQVEVKREVNMPLFNGDFTVTLTGVKPNVALGWENSLSGTGTATDIVMHKVTGMDYTYRALVPAQKLPADAKITFVQTTTGKEINLEYGGVQSEVITAGNASKYRVTLGWGIDPEHVYAVGDVYPHVGPAVGVVYSIENGGKNGKVVGLQEKESVKWSSAYSTTGATNSSNGRVNMATIHTLANDFSGFPAFKWIHDEMNGGGTTNYYSNPNAKGVWYLPAVDELSALYQVRVTVNTGLTSAGGTGLEGCDYRSSSENDNATARNINFIDGHMSNFDKAYVGSFYRARCVLAF